MARPQIVQELRHGKILSGSVFPNFVESWNYLKNRVESLRGDADIVSQYGCGHIKVDNTDPEHPVIRCVNLPKGGGGSVDVDTDVAMNPDSNSIQRVTQSYGEYIQLLNFSSDQRKTPSELSGTDDFLLRERTTVGQNTVVNLEYIAKQYILNPITDSQQGTRKSLESKGTYNGQPIWQFYKFDDADYTLDFGCLGSADSFVIRHDNEVKYVPANTMKMIPDSEIGCSYSLEGCGNSPKEWRLYNWMGCGCVWNAAYYYPTFWDLCAPSNLGGADIKVLVRRDDSRTLDYMDLRNLARFPDTEISNTNTESIDNFVSNDDKVGYRLHDFLNPSVQDMTIRLKYDGCAYHITNGSKTAENKQILVRRGTSNPSELEYWDFCIVAPKIGCGDVDQGLWDEIESSHCDCGSKWDDYYDWKEDVDDLLGLDGGDGCFWKTNGYSNTNTCYTAEVTDQLTIGASTLVTATGWDVQNNVSITGGLTVDGGANFEQDVVIDDAHTLTIGCTFIGSVQATLEGSVTIGCTLQIGSTYISSGIANIGCSTISDNFSYVHSDFQIGGTNIQLGSTTMSETQLKQLLALI